MEKHQTDRMQQQHSHPASNKIKTQYTEKTQPNAQLPQKTQNGPPSLTPPHMSEKSPTYSKKQMSRLPSEALTQLRNSPNHTPQPYPPLPRTT
jgi:hypothetical protein